MFDKGDAISQWPETKKGIIVDYYWDEHIDEPMYHIKWSDGKITTEYENTLNHYCNPDEITQDIDEDSEEDSEDRTSIYTQAFCEMYDLIEDGREFPDAKEDVTIKYNLSEEDQKQLVIDYDECERVNAMKSRL
jgi:RNA processing factor Prp31